MPHCALIEEPVQFGAGGLFGILTRPDTSRQDASGRPTFLLLNAGLLHRVGPSRLYVQLARTLAGCGFACLRVDLAGRGDSPGRPGLTSDQSLAADYEEIVAVLESREEHVRFVAGGLCSGADDAIRLAVGDERVVGLLLLDPVCFQDSGFRSRALLMKYSTPGRYLGWLKRRLRRLSAPGAFSLDEGANDVRAMDPLTLRDLPTMDQMRRAFRGVGERNGRVLAIFSGYATGYYNRVGQLRKVLGLGPQETYCEELFWPEVAHTYRIESSRRRLIERVERWASGHSWSADESRARAAS